MWRRCPGILNAADIVSRGALTDFLLEGLWFTGPTWLRCMREWPIQTISALTGELFVSTIFVDNKWWEQFSTWKRTDGEGATFFAGSTITQSNG